MSSHSEAATVTEAEEAPLCYICYEEEVVATNPFMSDDVCDCRGTMKVHQICYELVRGLGNRCKTCRSVMKKPHALDARWGIIYDNKQKFIAMWRDGPVPHGPAIVMQPASGGTGMYYIQKRANYANGQLDGAQTFLNESGWEIGVNNYRAGQKHGTCFENLTLELTESFSVLNAFDEYYARLNTVKLKVAVKLGGEFEQGLRTGVHVSAGPWAKYTPMWSVVETTYAADQKHGPEREYLAQQYDNRMTCRELGWRAGQQHGWERKYETCDADRYLYSEAHWREGQLDGPSRSYYPPQETTGLPCLKEEAHYFEGKLEGSQTKYSWSSGKPYMSEMKSWRAGVLEGPQLTRWEYEDGDSCSAYGNVQCGVKDGMFAEVTDTIRNRYLVRNYNGGVLDGPVTDVFYSNTSIKDDVVMSETNYKKGKKHGRQLLNASMGERLLSWLPTTFKAAELNFYEGRIHGKNTVYYDDNKVLCQGTFVKGVPVGRHSLLQLHNGGWMQEISYDKQGRLHGLCHYRDRYTGQMVSRLNYEHGRMAGRQIVYGAGNRETFSWTVDKADKEGKRLKGAVQWFNERCEIAEERFVRAEEELCVEDVLDEPIMIGKPATLKLAFEKESNTPNYAAREFYGYIIYPSIATAAAGATAEAVPLAAIAADDIECDCDYCLIGYGRRARAGNYYSDYEDDYLPCLYDSW